MSNISNIENHNAVACKEMNCMTNNSGLVAAQENIHLREDNVPNNFVSFLPPEFSKNQRNNLQNCSAKQDVCSPTQFAKSLFRNINTGEGSNIVKAENEVLEKNALLNYSKVEDENPILKAMNVGLNRVKEESKTLEKSSIFSLKNVAASPCQMEKVNSSILKEDKLCDNSIMNKFESTPYTMIQLTEKNELFTDSTLHKKVETNYDDLKNYIVRDNLMKNQLSLPLDSPRESKTCLKVRLPFLQWLNDNDVDVEELIEAEVQTLEPYGVIKKEKGNRSRRNSLFTKGLNTSNSSVATKSLKSTRKGLFKKIVDKFKRKKSNINKKNEILTDVNTQYNKLFLNNSYHFCESDPGYDSKIFKGRSSHSKSVNFADGEEVFDKNSSNLLRKYEKVKDEYNKHKVNTNIFQANSKSTVCNETHNDLKNTQISDITFFIGYESTAFKTQLRYHESTRITFKMVKDSLPVKGKNIRYYFKSKTSNNEEYFEEIFGDDTIVPLFDGEPICKIFGS